MFLQIDRSIEIKGEIFHVRCEQRPGNEWLVYDMGRKISISTKDKEHAFEEWSIKAKNFIK